MSAHFLISKLNQCLCMSAILVDLFRTCKLFQCIMYMCVLILLMMTKFTCGVSDQCLKPSSVKKNYA